MYSSKRSMRAVGDNINQGIPLRASPVLPTAAQALTSCALMMQTAVDGLNVVPGWASVSVGNRERPNTDPREAGEACLKAAQILDVVEVNLPHQRWPGRRRAEAEALAYRLICWDEFLRV